MDCRRAARSASGASGIMSDDRVAARLEDRERDQRHAHEHHHEADDPAHEDGEHATTSTGTALRLPPAYRAAGLASKSQSHSSPRAAYCTFFEMPSVSYCVHRKMRRRLLPDHLLDLRVDPLALGLVHARARLVDELVEALHPRVPLADPAARLGVVERVQHGVGVEDRVVAPGAVVAVGGLALGLEELVPRRARIPHARGGPDADLGQHLADRLEDRPELDVGAVQRDVHPVRVAGLGQQLLGLLRIVRDRASPRGRTRRPAAAPSVATCVPSPAISFWMMACLSMA